MPLKFKILPFKIFLCTRMNGTKYDEIGSSPANRNSSKCGEKASSLPAI